MPARGPARWAMPPCRTPAGNFCTDLENIGGNPPIPVVTQTSNGAASKAPAAVTPVATECARPARVRWSRSPA
jgi:hypothetical protein